MNEEQLLNKITESNGNTFQLGFSNDHDAETTIKAANNLAFYGKIELIELKKQENNIVEIKAYVK